MLQTLGSLILVAGVSLHLHRSSWQLVLLSFVVAGVGFAIWKVRKSIIRRAKIRALWQRSIEIDAMLDRMEEPQYVEPRSQKREVVLPNLPARPKTCLSLDGLVSEQSAPPVEPKMYKFSMEKFAGTRTPELQPSAMG